MKALSPILFVGLAIAAFFYYVKPQYEGVKVLQKEKAQYESDLRRVAEADQKRNDLVAKLNSFSTDDLERLEKAVPDSVDNIRLLVDINKIAEKYKTAAQGISIQKASDTVASSRTSKSAASVPTKPYDVVTLRFNVSMNYDNFILFMKDLENSLRIVDINSVGFKPGETATYTYQVALKTYWLK